MNELLTVISCITFVGILEFIKRKFIWIAPNTDKLFFLYRFRLDIEDFFIYIYLDTICIHHKKIVDQF